LSSNREIQSILLQDVSPDGVTLVALFQLSMLSHIVIAGSEAGSWSPWSSCSMYGVQQRRQQCTTCAAGFRLQERFCDPEQPRASLLTYLVSNISVRLPSF